MKGTEEVKLSNGEGVGELVDAPQQKPRSPPVGVVVKTEAPSHSEQTAPAIKRLRHCFSSARSPNYSDVALVLDSVASSTEFPGNGVLNLRTSARRGVDEARLLQMLECGICTDNMYPPIYQCSAGHPICAQCKEKVSLCPVCNSSSLDFRSRCLEELAECIEAAECRFRQFGCAKKMPYVEKKIHERSCKFGPQLCLHFGSCRIQGTTEQILNHLIGDHRYHQYHTDEIDFICSEFNASDRLGDVWLWQNAIYSCHGAHFALRVHRTNAEVCVSLLAVCEQRTSPHRYRLSVKGRHRECSYEGVAFPCRMGFSEVERTHDCLILKTNVADFMGGCSGGKDPAQKMKLRIVGRIFSPMSASLSATPIPLE